MPHYNVIVHVDNGDVAQALKAFKRKLGRVGLLSLLRHDSKLFVAASKGQRLRAKRALAHRRAWRRRMRAAQREAEFLETGGEPAAYRDAVVDRRAPERKAVSA
jgi:ribosomal protein S21